MVVGVVAQQGNERAQALAEDILTTLGGDGIEVWIDQMTARALDRKGTPMDRFSACELVASIGGDGTFLFTAQSIEATPMIGVNLGEVGFLNAVAPDDATDVISETYRRAQAGDLPTKALPRVRVSGTDWELGPALNEIILHAPHRATAAGITATITVDGEQFTTDRADGVIIATPTGSTAYNLSEGGPLLAPAVPGLVITEMCGRKPMPSVVVPLDATIEATIDGDDHAVIVADGRNRVRTEIPTTVTVRRAETPLHVGGPPIAFFDALGKLD